MFKFRWFRTTAKRESTVLDVQDFAVDIEAQQCFIGDGETMGGIAVSSKDGGVQVNSDWNATSGVAQILNKPTIPSALSALSGDATHRLVSDSDIAAWNAKQGALTAGVDYLAPAGNGSSLTGLTAAQVGLGNVNNTSDMAKPVSTSVQTALNLKQDISTAVTSVAGRTGAVALAQADVSGLRAGDSPSFAGLTVNGDLNVAGAVNAISSQNLTVKDTIITLNDGETGSGVTGGASGIDVDRGLLATAKLFWDEASQRFKLGVSTFYEILTTNSTTASLADSADRRYVTDAQRTVLGNTSGTNSGDVGIATANGLSLAGQQLSLQLASAGQPGALSAADWSTFNGKQAAGSYVTSGGALGTPSSGNLANCTFPTLNQNTTGTATNLSGTPALPNGTTATTQAAGDNSTKLATTAYADGCKATAQSIGTMIQGETAKATPVDADLLGLVDSAASWVQKQLSWANLKTALVNFLMSPRTVGQNMPYILGQSAVSALIYSASGWTAAPLSAATMASVTVPGGAMGPNGGLRIWTLWSCTSASAVKTFTIKFGTYTYLNVTVTTNSQLVSTTNIRNRNNAASQVAVVASNTGGTGAMGGAPEGGAINSAVDQTLTIIGQTALETGFTPSPASNMSGTGSLVTVVQTAHGLNTGEYVKASGSSTAGYNVDPVQITKVDANTFTYPGAGTGTPATAPLIQRYSSVRLEAYTIEVLPGA